MRDYKTLELYYLKNNINHISKENFIRRMVDIEFDLKERVKFNENLFESYKKMLENIFKDKINFPINDEFIEYYKELLRWGKNNAEKDLKQCRKELTEYNWGYQSNFNYELWLKEN